MGHWVKKIIETVSVKGGIFTFLRAQLSSQLASIADFSIAIVLANLFNLYYVYATFTGSVCGGIVNCVVNYRWTFKAMDVKKKYVAIRYLMVWCASIFLNTSGIYLMTEWLNKINWFDELSSFVHTNVFVLSKIIVSILVGFVWNYNMQRLFVYKNLNLKRFFHSENQVHNTK